jgi:hypothetical protein
MQIIPITIRKIKQTLHELKKAHAMTGQPYTKSELNTILQDMIKYQLTIYAG